MFLRGLIGLGNGRKRSKKYELFVLENRELLREQYSLCEKAAQKILGYSINFLYKKLRTNPEVCSSVAVKRGTTFFHESRIKCKCCLTNAIGYELKVQLCKYNCMLLHSFFGLIVFDHFKITNGLVLLSDRYHYGLWISLCNNNCVGSKYRIMEVMSNLQDRSRAWFTGWEMVRD